VIPPFAYLTNKWPCLVQRYYDYDVEKAAIAYLTKCGKSAHAKFRVGERNQIEALLFPKICRLVEAELVTSKIPLLRTPDSP
jgi:hypothetical protein